MLKRTFDATFANEVVNHPDVRPYVGPMELGELDFSDAISSPENWFLIGEYGGFALAWSAPGVYEVHVFILPEGRGAWAARARKWVIKFAKENGATMLWARIAPAAKYVSSFARRGGMKPTNDVIYNYGFPYDIFKMELTQCHPQ